MLCNVGLPLRWPTALGSLGRIVVLEATWGLPSGPLHRWRQRILVEGRSFHEFLLDELVGLWALRLTAGAT